MATTGASLNRDFQRKYDQSYSGYYDNAKTNALFKEVMFSCTDRRTLPADSQKAFDEIAQHIITQRVFSINNNRISTAPLLITSIIVTGGTYTVNTFFPHNLLITDTVTFADLTGNYASLNGTTHSLTGIANATQFNIQTGAATFAVLNNVGSVTFAKMVSDYLHLYAVKAKFSQLQEGLRVIATSGISPITIRLNYRSKFRDGSIMTLSGMTNATAANGTWYVKQLNSTSYQLFTDINLTVPSTGGVTTNGPQGVVTQIFYSDCTPLFSDRKIDKLETPTVELPKYEFAEKVIKFYPDNQVCSEINLDYIRIPQHFIDVNDDVFDLELVYPFPYLDYIVNMAIKSISIPLRDPTLNQSISQEIIEQQ